MGFVTSSRLQRRWPFGRVPYEISDSLGAVARTAITNAINAWQATAPVQFVPHGDEPDYVVSSLLRARVSPRSAGLAVDSRSRVRCPQRP